MLLDPMEAKALELSEEPALVFFETPKQVLKAGPGEVLVSLTRDYQALIDEIDEPLLKGRSFYAHQSRSNVYARNRELGYLHQLICGSEEGWVVDHVNRMSLDCRRNNLRIAGYAANAQNADYDLARSGFRGVTQQGRRWRARIALDGVDRHLGMYDTPELAARAYDDAALTIYGKFAWTNMPRDLTPEGKRLLIADDPPF